MVARPLRIDPRGGPVSFFGDLVDPAGAGVPLKIDLWQRVRHPPPELVHAKALKEADHANDYVVVQFPGSLIGRVVTWTWSLIEMPPSVRTWRVLLDVQQRSASIEGYPVEYEGTFEAGETYDELKISERVIDAAGESEFVGSYQLHKGK